MLEVSHGGDDKETREQGWEGAEEKYCRARAAKHLSACFPGWPRRPKREEDYISPPSNFLLRLPKAHVDLCSTASRLYALTFAAKQRGLLRWEYKINHDY